MGVNMAGNCIVDDAVCCEASRMEILRRYYAAGVKKMRGQGDENEINKLKLLMNQSNTTQDICPAVSAALEKAERTGGPAAGMVLPDGRIVTGKTSSTLGCASAMLLNAPIAEGRNSSCSSVSTCSVTGGSTMIVPSRSMNNAFFILFPFINDGKHTVVLFGLAYGYSKCTLTALDA